MSGFEHEYRAGTSHHALLYDTGLTVEEASAFPDVVEGCVGLEMARVGVSAPGIGERARAGHWMGPHKAAREELPVLSAR